MKRLKLILKRSISYSDIHHRSHQLMSLVPNLTCILNSGKFSYTCCVRCDMLTRKAYFSKIMALSRSGFPYVLIVWVVFPKCPVSNFKCWTYLLVLGLWVRIPRWTRIFHIVFRRFRRKPSRSNGPIQIKSSITFIHGIKVHRETAHLKKNGGSTSY